MPVCGVYQPVFLDQKIMRITVFFFGLLWSLISLPGCQKAAPDLRLWYKSPARMWEEALPLGNGRLGAMPDGGVERESITLNDITMWSGSVDDTRNPEALKYLPRIRQLLLEGKNDKAQQVMYEHFGNAGDGDLLSEMGLMLLTVLIRCWEIYI